MAELEGGEGKGRKGMNEETDERRIVKEKS